VLLFFYRTPIKTHWLIYLVHLDCYAALYAYSPSILGPYCLQISPRDIENVVLRHPGVADVTAVGVADAVVNGNGQLAKAVVVLKPGYDDVTSHQLLTYANGISFISITIITLFSSKQLTSGRRHTGRGKERSLPLKRSGMDHTVVTLQTYHTRLYLVAFTRRRHHCLVIAAIWFQRTTCLSTPGGWKAELT